MWARIIWNWILFYVRFWNDRADLSNSSAECFAMQCFSARFTMDCASLHLPLRHWSLWSGHLWHAHCLPTPRYGKTKLSFLGYGKLLPTSPRPLSGEENITNINVSSPFYAWYINHPNKGSWLFPVPVCICPLTTGRSRALSIKSCTLPNSVTEPNLGTHPSHPGREDWAKPCSGLGRSSLRKLCNKLEVLHRWQVNANCCFPSSCALGVEVFALFPPLLLGDNLPPGHELYRCCPQGWGQHIL